MPLPTDLVASTRAAAEAIDNANAAASSLAAAIPANAVAEALIASTNAADDVHRAAAAKVQAALTQESDSFVALAAATYGSYPK